MDIHILSASAGSGKTTALTGEMARALDPPPGLGVRPDRVLATTFTRKAAHELQERARLTLLDQGRWGEAQLLAGAWIGTVNAVCGQVLRDFAFDLGLSPDLEVIPEDEAEGLLLTACSEVLDEEPYAGQARRAAARFDIESWTEDVRKVVNLARNNGITPEALEESGRRSLEGMLALLEPVDPRGGAQMDRDLASALERAVELVAPVAAKTKVATDAVAFMSRARNALARGTLKWGERIKLARLPAGKANQTHLQGVHREASCCLAHPRLRADLEQYVLAVFRFAAHGLEHYRTYKERQRLIDFVDQEERVLTLLRDAQARGRIAERVEFLLVDEFQDTSPIQLAIFVQLARLARRAVWVGDPKQSIYGFRGADPALMAACLRHLQDRSRTRILDISYRSRPGLVRFTSAAFARAFSAQGMDARQVELTPRRDDAAQYGDTPAPPPLGLWLLQAGKQEEDRQAVAHGVRRLLEDGPAWAVIDRTSGTPRPPAAGDVAILCQSNQGCVDMAAALSQVGVAASLARPGLLDTPEGALAEAALRFLLDPGDSLAAAVITCLDGADGQTREEWLRQRLVEMEARRAETARGEASSEPQEPGWSEHAALSRLHRARLRAGVASPSEALETAMQAVDLPRFCLRLGRSAQRLDNLEALRGLARQYEARCATRRAAATSSGLVLYLREIASDAKDGQAHEAGADAVHVLTYHASKGLEWPVVILADLDRGDHPDPFGAEAASDMARLDPENPLAGRWIRFWLYPFGRNTADVPYLERARESEVGLASRLKDREQEARLLYVAMTRARDVMILAVRESRGTWKKAWLDRLQDPEGAPVLGEPDSTADGTTTWRVGEDVSVPVLIQRWAPMEVESATVVGTQPWFVRHPIPEEPGPPAVLAGRQRPLADEERARLTVGETVRFGRVPERLKATDSPAELGNAVHAFLAADGRECASPQERRDMARRLLAAFEQSDHLHAEDLVMASDSLREFVRRRHGEAKWHRELPLDCLHGEQEIHGIADLLLECPGGEWVVVDHKTYNGPPDTWPAQAEEHLPQLEAYAHAVEVATGARVRTLWLHFPLGGGLLELRREAGGGR